METPIVEEVPLPEELPSPGRLEGFSDGVFAIIITLLVLDLKVPREEALEGRSLGGILLEQWPVYLAYLLSFLQVGVVWFNHHTIFHYIKRTDHLLLIWNLLLLLFTALLPFTTAMLSEYTRGPYPERRLAALVYSTVLGIAGIFFNAVWRHALRAKLIDPRADPHRLHALGRHWMLVPVFYGVAFGLAWINPNLSLGIYAVLLFYFAIPGPVVVRWVTARGTRRASNRAPPTPRTSRR